MSKRSAPDSEKATKSGKTKREADDDSGSDEDFDILNVDFEFFDPQTAIDFHGIKTLLTQLFDADSPLIPLSPLTDLILSQPLLGSTVKVDGNETDAYAFLSVINLQQHASNPAVSKLTDYLRAKAASTPTLAPLAALLAQSPLASIGLILTERLINVPSEVVPPMYSMLLEEIEWAIAEAEPYSFTHYVILSKTYSEVASKLDTEDDRPKKKSKAAKSGKDNLFYFHPEDEVFERSALCAGGFTYSTKVDDGRSDSKRAFQEMGIKPQGHIVLVEAGKFRSAVEEVQAYLKPGHTFQYVLWCSIPTKEWASNKARGRWKLPSASLYIEAKFGHEEKTPA